MTDLYKKKMKRTQCLYHNERLGAVLYTLKSVGGLGGMAGGGARAGKRMLNNLSTLLSLFLVFVAWLRHFDFLFSEITSFLSDCS